MPLPPFIRYAQALEGPERGKPLTEASLLAALRADEPAWVHLDGTDPRAEGWISQNLDYLDAQAIRALLEVDTRSRVTPLGKGLILVLRGLNFNEGESRENMVSVRMWIDAHRIVTISRKRVMAVERMNAALAAGQGPRDSGRFLARMVEDVVENIAAFQKDQDVITDELENKVIEESEDNLRKQVVDLRLRLITTLRYLVPQRDALAALAALRPELFGKLAQRTIEEEHGKMTRIVEDVAELRDRAAVLREELSGQISDRLNRNMFVLSVLSAVFLPLGFLTGLFGVNVGGLPGLEDRNAFLWLCLFMGGILVLQLALLWRMRWIGRGG